MINADGSPHVMAVGIIFEGGKLYFNSGPNTRKSRNIAADPRCAVSLATQSFDIVVEGAAARVTDSTELRCVADAFNRGGWPAEVAGDALTAEFSAPSAGPPPSYLYRLDPATVFALATGDPSGATKFQLG
jgi:hypothetical protein